MEAVDDTQREAEIQRVAQANREAGEYVETLAPDDVIILGDESESDEPAEARN